MDTNILVVDDEKEIADLVEACLLKEHYHVYKAYTAREALELIDGKKIDLAVLDIMIPGMDGFELCRYIRQSHTYPVIMLTAKDEAADKVNGLVLGADDYVTKPFLPMELAARVNAQLRRVNTYNRDRLSEDEITAGGLTLNKRTHTCLLNGKMLSLTKTEFSILWILCIHKGEVVPSEQIFFELWGEKYYSGNNTIMVHVRHLREKMNDSAEHPKYIQTVWGVGYKIEA